MNVINVHGEKVKKIGRSCSDTSVTTRTNSIELLT